MFFCLETTLIEVKHRRKIFFSLWKTSIFRRIKMACATLIHSQPSKRRIDSVDGVETGPPSKCKRSVHLDFGLSSASFGSPPRLGRASPPTGRLSPKYFAKPSGSSSPPLSFSPLSTAKVTETASWSAVQIRSSSSSSSSSSSPSTSKSTVIEDNQHREPRVSINQVVELCKQELRQLDSRLRHEYEQALQDKLAEQYQSFIQFAQDELQVSMQGAPPDAEMSYIG
ncbi:hypothetical protein BV898_17238 [Hypsibius exemplaris]|uniref:Akirin n=1 Tax=Hypsibius exemplaris TaxID=2072580 RepID=A0A9X6NF68_HYPEX|nr:hypothetical protein BV898_17238 [Hypsibius exemplaris]